MPRRPAAVELPASARALLASGAGLATTAELLDAGLTRSQLRSLVRTSTLFAPLRGVWSDRPVAEADLVRRVAAARLAVGGGAACFATAAELFGLPTPSVADRRIHLTLRPDRTRHQAAGIALHWLELDAADVTAVHGLPVTSAARLLRDVARRWTRGDVVALLDAGLRAALFTLEEVAGIAATLPSGRRAWLALGDPRSESPLETYARLLLVDSGFRHIVPQLEVRAPGGRFVARVDLAIPSSRIAIECDGRAVHDRPEALYRDRQRQDDLLALGWRPIRVTGQDLRHDPEEVIRRVRRAVAQAA